MRSALLVASVCLVPISHAQSAKLQLKFPKGQTDRMTSVTHMVQSYSVPGQTTKMDMVVDQSVGMLLKVISADAKGATVRSTYENLKSVVAMNGSKNDTSAQTTKLLKGKSVDLFFGPDGKVRKVTGLDKVLAQPGMDESSKALFKQLMGDDAMKQIFNNSLGVLPNRTVKVGESWTSKASMGQGPMKMVLDMRLKLTKVSGTIATIGVTGVGSVAMSDSGSTNFSYKSKSLNVSGTMTFDTARGWLRDQNMDLSMAGTMTVSAQGKTSQLPLTSKIKSTVQTRPAK